MIILYVKCKMNLLNCFVVEEQIDTRSECEALTEDDKSKMEKPLDRSVNILGSNKCHFIIYKNKKRFHFKSKKQ